MAMRDRTELRKQLESGLPVLIYDFDGREEETDMLFYAGSVTWKSVNVLRKEARGLICYVTSERVRRKLLQRTFGTPISFASQG
jgi:3,4-dihydroxy 2-butanone 4-phosphate synthase